MLIINCCKQFTTDYCKVNTVLVRSRVFNAWYCLTERLTEIYLDSFPHLAGSRASE